MYRLKKKKHIKCYEKYMDIKLCSNGIHVILNY